jgi:hypothetical protein
MRRGAGRHLIVGLRVERMHHVGKLDGVLNEKDRDIVPHQIPNAVFGIKLRRKTPRVTNGVRCSTGTVHVGEADEHRSLHGGIGKDGRFRVLGQRLIDLKIAMRSRTSGMHDSLRHRLVVEVRHFFSKMKVLENCRTSRAGLQRIVVIGNANPLIRRQRGAFCHRRLFGIARRDSRLLPVGLRQELWWSNPSAPNEGHGPGQNNRLHTVSKVDRL